MICRDPRTLPAGGATEVEVARQLSAFGAKMTGLEQYAVAQFAEALEVVPRTIAENSGGSACGSRPGLGAGSRSGVYAGHKRSNVAMPPRGCQRPCDQRVAHWFPHRVLVAVVVATPMLLGDLMQSKTPKSRLAHLLALHASPTRQSTGWTLKGGFSAQSARETLDVPPRAGLNATEVLAALRAAHAEGRVAAGLDVVTGQARELAGDGIVDLYQTKWWALRLAADAAVTVLKVDQIIMVRTQRSD